MKDALPAPALCKVGRAQVKITPPLPVSLAGYFHDRVAESVRDDLFARAMVIESGGVRVALVSCDLATVTAGVVDPAKEMIERETGIPPSHVLVCATHTHTGPEMRADGVVPVCPPWVEALPGRIAEAVIQSSRNLVSAHLRLGRTRVEGYAYNRLYRLEDGREVFGVWGSDKKMLGPAGPIDPELQTLAATDEAGNPLAMAVNFALHPDVIGGGTADFVSADWPGEMAKAVSAVYGPEMVTLFLQGTAGDINQHPYEPKNLPIRGISKAVSLGRGLAGAAVFAHERSEPMTAVPVVSAMETLTVPYYTRDEQFMREIEELKANKESHPFSQYIIERGESWPHDGKSARVPIQAMRIGDAGVVGFPAEMFAAIGLNVKRWSPAANTLVVELANDRVSTYVPTTDQAERGAYGATPVLSRWLCADAGRQLADAAQVLLHRIWG